ncbi:(3R)-3-hydroxyacyl-CoA dehydrogenase [Procambarus clarkii]|uniref:(3R)-3-hydroxyacyl-CoA dehydrogenase n=1 Tax=Procambarus clarkii TaxID=6728 RepID=UPI001E675DB7|nr:estradiol 17-beta-dehydrogenase 8-like [Procambarus clarkii]
MSTPIFAGKVALVTGGGSGIGRAICQVLARDGANVAVADINLQGAQETVSMLPSPGDHLAVTMDVASKASVDSGLKAVTDKYQTPPSLLVNNAGIVKPSPFLDMEEKAFVDVLDVNLKGTFLVSQAVVKLLLEQPGAAGGAVVNISSVTGQTGFKNYSQYAASKAGVMAFTKSVAGELAKTGVRVNCVLPGVTQTPLLTDITTDYLNEVVAKVALGRMGQPEEVAEVVAFLLSDKSSYMTGSCVEVYGGYGL